MSARRPGRAGRRAGVGAATPRVLSAPARRGPGQAGGRRCGTLTRLASHRGQGRARRLCAQGHRRWRCGAEAGRWAPPRGAAARAPRAQAPSLGCLALWQVGAGAAGMCVGWKAFGKENCPLVQDLEQPGSLRHVLARSAFFRDGISFWL